MVFPIGFATGAGVPTLEEMAAAKDFGAKFIRCGIPWDNGSSAPDRNFDQPNAITNAISFANFIGLGIVLQIGAGSTYGGSMYTHSGPGGFDVLGEFVKFCANVCRAFNGSPGDPNYVWAVEIGNEANHAKWNDPFLANGVTPNPYFVHWTGTAPTGPQRYAETFLRLVHPTFENVRATPGCPQIITTGLGGERDTKGINSFDFTVATHQDLTFAGTTYPGGLWRTVVGANPWYSGYDLHPYFYPETDPLADTDGGWLNMRQIMAWFQTNRGETPPLWISEVGYPTKPETFANCIAARDALANMVADLDSRSWDIRGFAWFSMMNNNKPDDSGNDNYFGVVDQPASGTDPRDGVHKPGPPVVPAGNGQLFDKFFELATRTSVLPQKFGTAKFEGGGTFTGFGTNNVVVIPDTPTYDKTGTADITSAMQALIESLPNGTRLRPQPGAVYRCEETLLFDGTRTGGFKNILFDGRGATFKCNVSKFYSSKLAPGGVVAGCTIGAPTWVYGNSTIKTVTAPAGTTPFLEIRRTQSQAWYVEGTGTTLRTQGAKDMSSVHQPNVPAPTSSVIHILSGISDAPANGTYTLTFTSPEDRNRANFKFDNCKDFLIKNLKVQGANTAFAAFKNELEAQAGFWIMGGVDGFEVKGCEIHHGHGDNITMQCGSGTPLKNVSIHDNDLHHATRQSIAIGGLIDAEIVRNLIRDSKRHIFDIEPNGGNQTCQRIHIHDNDLQRGGLGIMAISTYGWLPMFIGDIRFSNNRCVDYLNIPIGTNHDRPATQPRWGPFTLTNNTATQAFGTGAAGASWANAPALFKFQYVDGIVVTGNVCNLQPGRLMYVVWAEKCTNIEVHDNWDQAKTIAELVQPPPPTPKPDPAHYELHTDNYAFGFATFKAGGLFVASGVSVPSTHGSAQLVGGGVFAATGKGLNHASLVTFKAGGTFPAVGRGKSYGTATFSGGGDFAAAGLGQNFGAASFSGGGDFTALGTGINYGTATFDGGGTFPAIGFERAYGTATFVGGGVFTALGVGQNFGVATFKGEGTFPAIGSATTYGTATFNGGGVFPALGKSRNRGKGFFDGGGTFSAFGSTDFESGYQDGEWLVGAVKLRSPGWDDRPWDTGPWDGEE